MAIAQHDRVHLKHFQRHEIDLKPRVVEENADQPRDRETSNPKTFVKYPQTLYALYEKMVGGCVHDFPG